MMAARARSGSLPARMHYLLKARLFRGRSAEVPAKASMVVEGLVLLAALVLGVGLVVLVVWKVRMG